MKKLVFLSVLLFCSIGVCFGQLTSKVDERIELTCAVFRIAGVPEYTQGSIEEYNQDIDKYFHKYRYHDLIGHIITLRNENRLGYTGVMGAAMLISIENGKVIQNPQVPISKLPGLGSQWSEETFREYVRLLNDFYQKAKFHKFFVDHQSLYAKAEAGLDKLLESFNGEWIADFFGAPFQSPLVYVALGNGRNNYYIIDFAKDNYGVVIGGNLSYDLSLVLPAVIHEICHNYSDPLFKEYWSQMEPSANIIYQDVADEMRKNAYGSAWGTMLEWQNNLCTTMYFRDNFPLLLTYFPSSLRDRGFIWLPRSVQFMENFYANRDKYPHIDSFMPQLAAFLQYTAEDFDMVKYEFENRHPHIVNVYPANGSNITDVDFDEIRLTFSQPMASDCYGFWKIKDDAQILKMPRSQSKAAYWADSVTFVIPIDKSVMEKGHKYGLVLDKTCFMTDDYNKLENDYTIIYNTLSNEDN